MFETIDPQKFGNLLGELLSKSYKYLPYELYAIYIIPGLESRWHSPYELVYKDTLLTHLLVSVPSILTLRYITVVKCYKYISKIVG